MHLPRLLSEAAPSHPSLGSSIPSRACVVWSSLIARPGLCVSRLCSCCAFALETFVQTQGPLGPSRQHFFFWEVLVVIVVVSHVQHAMVGRSLGHSLSFSRPLLPASLPQPWFHAAAFSHYHCIWTQMQASSGKLPQMGEEAMHVSVTAERVFLSFGYSAPILYGTCWHSAFMHMYKCVCTYTHTTHMHVHTYMCTHILHTCTHTYTTHTTTHMHVHTHILYTHTTHMHVHTYIYYTHTHTYTLHTCKKFFSDVHLHT